MSCHRVQEFISAYADRSSTGEEQERMTQHLARCRECALRSEQAYQLRAMLRGLPAAAIPPVLATRLRVAASHERARRLARIDGAAPMGAWAGQVRLFIGNLMRPVALPFAGGLASALFLFSMLVPTLFFQFNLHNDVPISAFYTEPGIIEAAPFGFSYEDVAVELTLNEKGLVTDYSVSGGKLDRNAENSMIANLVFFSSYSPATLFGRPTSAKVQIVSRRSRIVVRG